MNSEAAGTEWIREAAENFEVVEWYYGQYPNARNLEFSVSDVERMLAALAEVIARNVQPSPEQRGVCDGKHGHYPHPKGICSDPSSWRPFEARPVPQPATERCGDLSFDRVSRKCILEKGHKGYCVFEQPAMEPDEQKLEKLVADTFGTVTTFENGQARQVPGPAFMAIAKQAYALGRAALALRDVPQGQQIDWADAEKRLAKFIAAKESRRCKTLESALYHQSTWERILPEAAEMLNEVFPVAARQVPVSSEKEKLK